MKTRPALLVAAALTLLAETAAAEDADLRNFIATYRCAIVERLKIVHANPAQRDRYFIFSLKRDKQAYVQCLFLADRPNMLCEASSGFYLTKPGKPRSSWRVPPDRLAALAQLGFSTDDSAGNYQLMLDLRAGADIGAIADLILTAIYQGYGARIGTPMSWNAPLIPRDDDSEGRCTPIG
jgi:hypothetical protein